MASESNRTVARDYAIPYLLGVVYVGVAVHNPIAWRLGLFSLGTSYLTGLFKSKEERLGPDELQLNVARFTFYLSLAGGMLAFLVLL